MLSHDVVWSAYNRASYDTFKEFGVNIMEWVTEGDDRVCPYCEEHEGREYRIGQFVPWLPAHVDCRCFWDTVIYG